MVATRGDQGQDTAGRRGRELVVTQPRLPVSPELSPPDVVTAVGEGDQVIVLVRQEPDVGVDLPACLVPGARVTAVDHAEGTIVFRRCLKVQFPRPHAVALDPKPVGRRRLQAIDASMVVVGTDDLLRLLLVHSVSTAALSRLRLRVAGIRPLPGGEVVVDDMPRARFARAPRNGHSVGRILGPDQAPLSGSRALERGPGVFLRCSGEEDEQSCGDHGHRRRSAEADNLPPRKKKCQGHASVRGACSGEKPRVTAHRGHA